MKIKHLIYCLILSIIIHNVSNDYQIQWTKYLGTVKYDNLNKMIIDSNDNIYVIGQTQGNLEGTTNAGLNDGFLIKFDSLGQKVWTRFVSTTGDDYIEDIAIDSNKNIYITGQTTGKFSGTTNAGLNDIFLIKYDSQGNILWTKLFGTSKNDYSKKLLIDPNHYIYISGDTEGSLDGNTNAGRFDGFLTKYDSLGNKQWTKLIGSNMNEEIFNIAIDSFNNIYITGTTEGNLDNNTNSSLLTKDVFITKFNSQGIKQWTKLVGSTGGESVNYLAIDSENNIYIVGITEAGLDEYNYYGTYLVKFDLSGQKKWTRVLKDRENAIFVLDKNNNIYYFSKAYDSINDSDQCYINKFDSLGNEIWNNYFYSNNYDDCNNLALDSYNNIYLIGKTMGNLDGNQNAGIYDGYVIKYNTLGQKEWSKMISSSKMENLYYIAFDSKDNIYITGTTEGNINGNVNNGDVDIFLIKFLLSNCYSSCETCNEIGDLSDHKCLTCNNDYIKLLGTNNCYNKSTPPDGYYLDNNEFKSCSTGCKTCTGSSNTQCATCIDNYYLFQQNSCYTKDAGPTGYALKSNQWTQCYSSCETCNEIGDLSDHKCLTCISSKIFFNNSCYDINNPPLNYIWNLKYNLFTYSNCYESCDICYDSGNFNNHNCNICKTGYFKIDNNELNNCYDNKLDGYFFNSLINKWSKCDVSCSECSDLNSCISCNDSFIKHPNNSLCLSECGNGYFKDNKICKPCDFPCENCESIIDCLSCKLTFTYESNTKKCIKNCLSNEYLDTEYNCKKCSDSCSTCSDNLKCLSCKEKKILFNYICYDSCPEGFFLNNINNCQQIINEDPKNITSLNTTSSNETSIDIEQNKFILNNLVNNNDYLIEEGNSSNNTDIIKKLTDIQYQLIYFITKYSISLEKDSNEIKIFKIIDNALSATKILNNITLSNNSLQKRNHEEVIIGIKKKLNYIVDDFITDNLNSGKTLRKIVSTNKNYNLQVYSLEENNNKVAIDNNISIYEIGICLNIISNYLKIKSTEMLPAMKIDYVDTPMMNNTDNQNIFVSLLSQKSDISLYHPYNGSKIDISNICNNREFNIYHPVSNLLNYTRYNEFKLRNIDIYNINDEFFNDICYPYSYDLLSSDLPLPYRRSEISNNLTIDCRNGCIYDGINSFNYIKCRCINTTSSLVEIYNTYSFIINSNLNIIKCVDKSFYDKMIIQNLGFWIYLFLIFLILISILVSIITSEDLYKNKESIIRYDSYNNTYIYTDVVNTESDKKEYSKIKSFDENKFNNTCDRYITHGNLNIMNISDIIKYDNRPFKLFLIDNFLVRYIPLSTFYHSSIYRPRLLKIITYIFSISLIFLMNSLFYTDELIYKRYYSSKNEYNITSFVYPWRFETFKIFISILITILINIIVESIVYIDTNDEINGLLIQDKDFKKARSLLYKNMLLRYIIGGTIMIFFIIFGFIYCTVFCYIYKQSYLTWLYGSIWGILIINCVLGPLKILILAIIRKITKLSPNSLFRIIFKISLKIF